MREHLKLWCCMLALLLSVQVQAQRSAADAWPSRPVSVVIPFSPGGSTDNEARLYTQKLQESTGQPFVFDFRPGGGSMIGAAFVAKAVPDGYTILIVNSGLTVLPNFYPDLSYDIIKSFAPITLMTNRAAVLLVSPVALPNIHSLAELIAYARTRPGELNCGTSGPGGITHIVCAALASATGTKLTYVHYKGVSQGQIDLVAGRTHLSGGTLFAALPSIKSGKLRAIAILSEQRTRQLPDMRTASEQGVDIEYPSWLGALAPAATPAAIMSRLHAEFVKAVRAPDVVKQLDAQGSEAIASTPDAFRKRMLGELARWKKVIQDEGIKAEE